MNTPATTTQPVSAQFAEVLGQNSRVRQRAVALCARASALGLFVAHFNFPLRCPTCRHRLTGRNLRAIQVIREGTAMRNVVRQNLGSVLPDCGHPTFVIVDRSRSGRELYKLSEEPLRFAAKEAATSTDIPSFR